MLDKVLEIFLSIPATLVVAAAFLLPAAETAVFLGLFIPGEVVVIVAGILAGRGRVPLLPVILASVAGAFTGDTIGYFVGKHLREHVERRFHGRRWTRARDWLKRRGLPAVFVARFTAFIRSVMPAAAGAARLGYRRFALWCFPAGVLWGTGSVLLGYFAARHSEAVLRWARWGGVVLFAAAVVYLVRALRRRRMRRKEA
jgi:membrane-associated protein